MYVYMYVCVCVCRYVCMNVCVCMYMYIYIGHHQVVLALLDLKAHVNSRTDEGWMPLHLSAGVFCVCVCVCVCVCSITWSTA